MHPRILAKNNAIATDRMVAAAPRIAERFGVEERVSAVEARDASIRQMMRNEAVADLLDALAEVDVILDAAPLIEAAKEEARAELLDEIEAIDGIGAKTMETIRAGLEEEDADTE